MKLFLFALLFPFAVLAADVKLMSWNVYMLPRPIKFSKQNERTTMITEALSKVDHDVIVLEEAFMDGFREKLGTALRKSHPYQTELGRDGRLQHVMPSGLFILSKFPFRIVGTDYYKDCGISDCFAAKGVIVLELTTPDGKVLQVGGTHMQAGNTTDLRKVRNSQLLQIKNLFAKVERPGVPQVLAGDLNIEAYQGDEFPEMLKYLNWTNGKIEGDLRSTKADKIGCYAPINDERFGWIDHFLLNENKTGAAVNHMKVLRFQGQFDGVTCDLSDHLAIESSVHL